MTLQKALSHVIQREDLSFDDAASVMRVLMMGENPEALVGGFLIALQMKGVTGDEAAGFAHVLQERAEPRGIQPGNLVDTCGTGGGSPSFNMSTGAALLAAACGAKVAKHGNRAVTSHCGSADVLEAMGISIEIPINQRQAYLDQFGVLFLFAPNFHPALRTMAPARKALGVRTVFNMLGPLANPAGAKRQMIGVYDAKLLGPEAEALQKLGCEHGFVVHGSGLDEISPCTETAYIEVFPDGLKEGTFQPEDFGIPRLSPADLAPAPDAKGSAAVLEEALSNSQSKRALALIPNTAVTLTLAGLTHSVKEGAELARTRLAEGFGVSLLDKLRSFK
jgi:anthranilate phosphoribosyltransferase